MKNNMKYFIKKLAETFSILLGLFIVIFLIWNRLRVRLPKVLDGVYSLQQYVVFCFLFFIMCVLLFVSVKKILNYKLQPNGLINKLFEIPGVTFIVGNIIIYIFNAPKNLYNWLYDYIIIRPFIETLGVKIWNYDPYNINFKYMLFFTYSIRIFICVIFIIDIFYFHCLKYFYKSLILVLGLMIFRVCLYIIKDLSQKNKIYIETEYLIIEANETGDGFYVDPNKNYEEILTQKQIDVLSVNWVAYLANCMFVDKIYDYDSIYKKYIDFFCYSMYVVGWGYIIFLT